MKEAVRGSRSFHFVNDEPAPTTPRIDVHLVSLNAEIGYQISSAIAYTVAYDHFSVPFNGILLTYGVVVCGRDRVESCAKMIMPKIDGAAESLRQYRPDLWQTLVTGNATYSEQDTPDAFSRLVSGPSAD